MRHFFRIWCQHNDADWRAVSADVGQRRNLLSREPKTMAGLLIRELIMRGDAKRILTVSPGSFTEQWQNELLEKFGVTSVIFSREKQEQ